MTSEVCNLFFSAKQNAYCGHKIGLLEDGREIEYTEMCKDEHLNENGEPKGNRWDDLVFVGKGNYLRQGNFSGSPEYQKLQKLVEKMI